MNKFKKAIKIVLISLAIILGCGFLVLYIIDKELATSILNTVVDFLNKPLPIVGASLLVLAGLVWKIFSASSFGKRAISKMKMEYESQKAELKKDAEEKEIKYTAIIALQNNKIDAFSKNTVSALRAIPNKKVQVIADNLETESELLQESTDREIKEVLNSSVEELIKSKEELKNEIIAKVTKEIVIKYGKESEEVNNRSEKE